jgi:DNA-binding transcriptional MerR regulator
MSNLLEDLKDIEYNGVRELARAAEHFLRSTGMIQEKGTVADYPNERTIRYYITEGLLDQAIKKRGVTSVFGYEHLLTLLTIKKLQSDGLPVSVIKTLISDKSTEELEKLLGEEVHVFTSQTDLDDYRRSIGHTDDSEVVVLGSMPPPSMRVSSPIMAPPPDPKKNEAKEYLESLLFEQGSKPERPPSSRPPSAPPQPRLARGTSDWRRYEIVPGVELHIARSFRPPQDETYRQRILVLIDGIINSRVVR